jgi:hypothetical protein
MFRKGIKKGWRYDLLREYILASAKPYFQIPVAERERERERESEQGSV